MARQTALVIVWLLSSATSYGHDIRIVDEDGAPIKHFEAMWHTAERGYGHWESGGNGTWNLDPHHLRDTKIIDVLVRADGYATSVQRFETGSNDSLAKGKGEIRLARGHEVELRLKAPPGLQIPDDFLPQVYFPDFAWRVHMMWQPVNQRGKAPDFNQLNVKRIEADCYSFRLADKSTKFLVAFNHPGWLRFHERGPLSENDAVQNVLTLDVPKPAGIEVRFDTSGKDFDSLPFDEVHCTIYWPSPSGGNAVYAVNRGELMVNNSYRITDIGPGKYTVQIRTKPKDSSQPVAGLEINPGIFHARNEIEARAGKLVRQDSSFVPFDPRAMQGTGNARIKVLLPNGEPALGKPLKITWFDGHYGSLTVLDRPIGGDGAVDLHKVSTKTMSVPFGPYSVLVGDETVGYFRLKETDEIQNFEFRISPKAGDAAPDLIFSNVQTNGKHRLSEYRGKIILVEFWATWCGPCQPAMSKLVEHSKTNQDKWGNEVVIIPLSTDHSRDRVAQHIAGRAWDTIDHFWADRTELDYFSTAETIYGVHGVPHSVLIDPNGQIVWLGHPMDATDGKDLISRIESLRKK